MAGRSNPRKEKLPHKELPPHIWGLPLALVPTIPFGTSLLLTKYWGRVLKISRLGLSAYYSLLAYNTYAVSCLEYLRQLYWAPDRLFKLEARALSIILKTPHLPMA